ncbi:MAG: SSI family serine proteinase inhibitor [Nocardiopsaceae bacterium]|nr:SSI family serine proteinase inhibitor [Nocardiopsaceae bacterium]
MGPAEAAVDVEHAADVAGRPSGRLGGTHPAPADACAAVENVKGRFGLLPTENTVCLTYWDPVTVVATGEGFGNVAEFEDTYSNETCASAGSDGIFHF